MNTHLKFDFIVNKEANTIDIKRAFAANLDLVWDAWTLPELLDQWWAPKPFKVETKKMDFSVGGYWLYSMLGPANEIYWSRADFDKIEVKKSFEGWDAFCDEEGRVNDTMPRSHWHNVFESTAKETTTVHITISYKTLADLEAIIAIGFKEGFSMALENLDQYLEAQTKLRVSLKTNNNARVCTYLNFAGNTEEAMNFYKVVFKSDFSGKGIQRFGDIPQGPDHPPIPDNIKHMILHVELPILGNHVIMATDAPKEMGFTLTTGNNMYISLEPESRAETDRIFNELSEGGNVTMSLKDMFFGAYYGEFTDKYGINWMLNYVEKE
jgi:uncharacterized glyoxalase superfamily protein PhnB/uncharacterized protein YndB with AHSA1/START domain